MHAQVKALRYRTWDYRCVRQGDRHRDGPGSPRTHRSISPNEQGTQEREDRALPQIRIPGEIALKSYVYGLLERTHQEPEDPDDQCDRITR